MFTVYSKPNCPQCVATKKYLTNKNIAFKELDVSNDPGSAEHLKKLGFLSLPVVEIGDKSWSGFRPDLINQVG